MIYRNYYETTFAADALGEVDDDVDFTAPEWHEHVAAAERETHNARYAPSKGAARINLQAAMRALQIALEKLG